jgi:hypothetical protein
MKRGKGPEGAFADRLQNLKVFDAGPRLRYGELLQENDQSRKIPRTKSTGGPNAHQISFVTRAGTEKAPQGGDSCLARLGGNGRRELPQLVLELRQKKKSQKYPDLLAERTLSHDIRSALRVLS